MKLNKKEIICIIVIYVIFLLIVSGPVMTNDSMIGFGIIEILGLFCYFRFTKGRLNDALSRFIWPVWLVSMLILGATIGVLIAPYHLGKWIASKIPDKTTIESNNNVLSYEHLMSLNEKQLKNVWMDLQRPCLVISKEYSEKFGEACKNQEFLQRPIESVYSCTTVNEALKLSDRVMEVIRKKYPKEINPSDLIR